MDLRDAPSEATSRAPVRATTRVQRTQSAIIVVTDLLLAALVPAMVFLVFSRAFHLGLVVSIAFAVAAFNGALFRLVVDVRSIAKATYVYRRGLRGHAEIVSRRGLVCEARLVDAEGARGHAFFLDALRRPIGGRFSLFYVADRAELVALDDEGNFVPGFRSHPITLAGTTDLE